MSVKYGRNATSQRFCAVRDRGQDGHAGRDAEVLIAGGGLVGLSAAAFLAHQGISPILVERHRAPLALPRARAFSPRTVELFRPLGLADGMLAAAAKSALTTFNDEATASGYSPVGWWVTADQDEMEVLIADFARDHGASVRYGIELLSFTVDHSGVRVELANTVTGAVGQVRARILVAADGYRSGIRNTLGIGVTGAGDITSVLSVVFRADLSGLLAGRTPGWIFVDQPRAGSVITPLRLPDRWVLMVPYPAADSGGMEALSADACAAMVGRAIGTPDVALEILPVAEGQAAHAPVWPSGSWVADRYRSGPVLFAGDAAHVMQPAGGLGASTGIQDAHNLAWKIAAVLRGDAGERLLDTYEAERRPVALVSAEQALLRGRHKEATGTAPDGLIDEAALVFGFRYRSPAVVRDDADHKPVLAAEHLSGQPGTRAPHIDLLDGTRTLSTLDLFGDRFVLLTDGTAGDAWHEAAIQASEGLRHGLASYRIGVDLIDARGDWRRRYGIGSQGAVLIRPDGVVCWRSIAGRDDPKAVLTTVLRRVLARD
jgi:putative polyketide hydroxylase